ncbi:hypothetical protein BDN72DRAFT_860060 [Pluteus cervinus]|uniref:Uncharacterized protein n=1 Tax=Pluteus cervinus TaxID=181527 RepID=A0ACD3AKL6_9AGAR|nr:hypothetical protein BDN72DRAFT_860060 [Pluteus cervinus]
MAQGLPDDTLLGLPLFALAAGLGFCFSWEGAEVKPLLQMPDVLGAMEQMRAADRFDLFLRLGPKLIETVPPEPPKLEQTLGGQEAATENAWNLDYKGDGARALWSWIQAECEEMHKKSYYAKYVPIIQSSGTGKSRTVDELGKSNLVIPMNLQKPHSKGFPPPDSEVYDYLVRSDAPEHPEANGYLVGSAEARLASFSRALAFLTGILHETRKIVTTKLDEDPPQGYPDTAFTKFLGGVAGGVPLKFHRFMNHGMTFGLHGDLRRSFYRLVIAQAKMAEPTINKLLHEYAVDSAGSQPPIHMEDLVRENREFPTRVALEELLKVYPCSTNTLPAIILAFDEAHTLIPQHLNTQSNEVWSKWGELRRALHTLSGLPLCALILSTTGKIGEISPPLRADPFARVRSGALQGPRPFTNLGLDHLAISLPRAENKYPSITQVTSIEHMAHYGRPLWASRYNCADTITKEDILSFAICKLLCRSDPNLSMEFTLDPTKQVACLFQRLPIEFYSTNHLAQESELELVEKHMRICLYMDKNRGSMRTVSPSEPILSEAAALVMHRSGMSPADVVKCIIQRYSINKGDRGELIVMLLFLAARDSVVMNQATSTPASSRTVPMDVDPDDDGVAGTAPIPGGVPEECDPDEEEESMDHIPFHLPEHVDSAYSLQRWCTVSDLLQALFVCKGRNFSELLEDTKECKIYFSHWIKVHQMANISMKYLPQYIYRGAGVQCGNNHVGIDCALPFIFHGEDIHAQNMGLILVQSNNDCKYNKFFPSLFDQMDLTYIVTSKTKPKLIIRIVFALASSTLIECRKQVITNKIPSYDIWVGGLSPDILQVTKERPKSWASFPQAFRGWADVYNMSSDVLQRDMMRSSNPGAALDEGFWGNWCSGYD